MAFDFEKARQRKARSKGWQPKDGTNAVRILPPSSKYYTETLHDFAIEFFVHFVKVDGEQTRVFRCFRDGATRRECPVCTASRYYKDTADPGLSKLADSVKRKERHVMNVLDLYKPDLGVQTYETGPQVYNDIMDFASNVMWGDLFNPEAGRNWIINMTPANKSAKGWNDYKVQPDPNLTNVVGMLPQDWLTQLDQLENAVAEYVEEKEAVDLLIRAGFPPATFGINPTVTAYGFPAPAAPAYPAPAANPVPVSIPVVPTAGPAPVAAPAPVPVAAPAAPAPSRFTDVVVDSGNAFPTFGQPSGGTASPTPFPHQ